MQASAIEHHSLEVVAGCTWFQNLTDNADQHSLHYFFILHMASCQLPQPKGTYRVCAFPPWV